MMWTDHYGTDDEPRYEQPNSDIGRIREKELTQHRTRTALAAQG